MTRPSRDECAEYYHRYISQVPDGAIVNTLESQREELVAMLRAVPAERGDFRYSEGKWTLKEVLGHMVDTERVFGYRALAMARRDPAALPSLEQDDYVAAADFSSRTVADLIDEWDALRRSHVILFNSFNDDEWQRRGIASDCEFSVRALAWIIAGHVSHHAGVIQERYL